MNWIRKLWERRGLRPGDPATAEWREYRRKCREVDRFNAGPGGYKGYPLPPNFTPPPIPPLYEQWAPANGRDDSMDIQEGIVGVLNRHQQVDSPEARCSCGHWGVGYREGWDWHVAKEIMVAAAFGRVLKRHAGAFDALKDL